MEHYHLFLLSNPLSLTVIQVPIAMCPLAGSHPLGITLLPAWSPQGTVCIANNTQGALEWLKAKPRGVGRKDSELVTQGVSKGFPAVGRVACHLCVSISTPAPGHSSFQALRNIPTFPPPPPPRPSPLCCGPVQKASNSLGLHWSWLSHWRTHLIRCQHCPGLHRG